MQWATILNGSWRTVNWLFGACCIARHVRSRVPGYGEKMRLLITGGAGFVGASLCRLFKAHDPNVDIVAFDNLKRRGSEQNLAEFKRLGVTFCHGDIRVPTDLDELPGNFDVMIEASAEPSVHAGTRGGTSCRYLLDTNLGGTLNALEFARGRVGGTVFLSTSRVYPIPSLRQLPLQETASRFELPVNVQSTGLSARGINEDFPTVGQGFRSLYGSTKLASELFIEEYAQNFAMPLVINRCGVIAGPGQFGKTDQGVFTLWVARHFFGGTLSYTGFGGTGKQVRDLLHPRDLHSLIVKQMDGLAKRRAEVFAVGGGVEGSVSLQEYTELCAKACGKRIAIGSVDKTADVDIPYFVMDASRAQRAFDWRPSCGPAVIVEDIRTWLENGQDTLRALFL